MKLKAIKLNDIKNYLYTNYKKIIKDPVKISLLVAILFSLILLCISIFYNDYNDDFFQGVRIEAYGMIFDLWIIGVLILFLNRIAKKYSDNQKYINEIDDFRRWESKEATFRIVGNIRRLNRNNVTNIWLAGCYLKKADLVHTNLQEADFRFTNLQEAILWDVNLQGANFQFANLQEADFSEANLQEADFTKANLQEAKNLTIRQLSKVKTLYLAKLDLELMEQIKEKYPHLLEESRQ